ncbi:hypothetical protein BEP19_12970 [Ammoniphilus oxalaticus]|uniref:Uncharacterized protein n=1 Tax=Ammoniphilus oxalaticus TaxID=66863 RepID=A0A419SH68_9BACL|nr:hypothetical protein BEP19_12970 [Ammoniphilus oxalaticus]
MTMEIHFDSRNNWFVLSIRNMICRTYTNPIDAADAVYLHVSGCSEWDDLKGTILNSPVDIFDWENS